jgi:antitoxin HigA-1
MVLPAISVSKVEIAAALGVSRQTLYDILAEKQPVTPGTKAGSSRGVPSSG